MSAGPLLIFGYGNISRGDDALAPLLVERLRQQGVRHGCGCQIKYLIDYQMHIEHVMDMQHCRRVLLVDAASEQAQAFRFSPVNPQQVTRYTTHGMSPSTLLHTYRQVLDDEPPVTAMLAIAGYRFELGQELSPQARVNLEHAEAFITTLLAADDYALWDASLSES